MMAVSGYTSKPDDSDRRLCRTTSTIVVVVVISEMLHAACNYFGVEGNWSRLWIALFELHTTTAHVYWRWLP